MLHCCGAAEGIRESCIRFVLRAKAWTFVFLLGLNSRASLLKLWCDGQLFSKKSCDTICSRHPLEKCFQFVDGLPESSASASSEFNC